MKSLNFGVFCSTILAASLSLFTQGVNVWADASAGASVAPGGPTQQGIVGMLVPFAAMFAVIYFLMIRPQQRKVQEQQSMLCRMARSSRSWSILATKPW